MVNAIAQTEIESHHGLMPEAKESDAAKKDHNGLICLVQMRYGLSREEAEKQVREFLATCK
ncbi:Uncharacterized protein ChrSV_2974 [Chromobacterium vaccinii]|nr:Uncharacterized protein ChrSW_2974 [Chromobacterium vaccinii]QND90431.1 Uncharacterized protein ChrSV_2974 [Chromobacterium vaccinii]SUX55223.1 Uncharacterised protein [Chromobacterium vaccinii]